MAGLNEAIQAALVGPERRDIDIRGHGFNVKPVDRQMVNQVFHIWGQISHKLRWRPDDQIYFHIVKTGDIVTSVDRQINRGGWGKILDPIGVVAGAYFGVPIPPGAVNGAVDAIARINPDGWEQACDMIIAAVAISVRQ